MFSNEEFIYQMTNTQLACNVWFLYSYLALVLLVNALMMVSLHS